MTESVNTADDVEFYTTTDVAKIFAVNPKTVVRWAQKGNFQLHGVEVVETPGGHRRFFKEQVNELYWKMIRDGGLAENE